MKCLYVLVYKLVLSIVEKLVLYRLDFDYSKIELEIKNKIKNSYKNLIYFKF